MLKTIKRLFNRLSRYLNWYFDSIKIRKIIKNNKNRQLLSNLKHKKILVLAPHSDDEWIGCFGFFKSHSCIVCSMDMDGGDSEDTKSHRFEEMMKLSKLYDYELVRTTKDKIEFLSNYILKERPDCIAVPFFIDWHKEHLDTILILQNALWLYKFTIIMYQVSCPIPTDFVNYVIPLSRRDHIYKWKLFKKIYTTQKNIPWKRFGMLEKAQGGFLNSYSSNVFCIRKSDEWIKMFDLIPSFSERERLKNNLNNLYLNYQYVNNLWIKK